jgi:sporulation protein YabP
MIKEEKTLKSKHNIMLNNRESLTITGVSDVDSFDDQVILVYTEIGRLEIKGKDLHISKLSLETGDLSIDGKIVSLIYSDNQLKGAGFFSKIFK